MVTSIYCGGLTIQVDEFSTQSYPDVPELFLRRFSLRHGKFFSFCLSSPVFARANVLIESSFCDLPDRDSSEIVAEDQEKDRFQLCDHRKVRYRAMPSDRATGESD